MRALARSIIERQLTRALTSAVAPVRRLCRHAHTLSAATPTCKSYPTFFACCYLENILISHTKKLIAFVARALISLLRNRTT